MTPEQARKTLDRLIAESAGDTYASVSAMLGRNPAYIQQYIKRGQPKWLSERDRLFLAQHFGVSEEELGAPLPSSRLRGGGDICLVPIYSATASAGHGTFIDQENVEGTLPLMHRQLREITDAPLEQLGVIRVRGDSMYPTLSDGDSILVDLTERQPARDAIYVLRNDEAVQVKRLLIHPATGKLTVKSDNPLYETWHDCDSEQITILGRVVWVGRKL